jgi:hypothetical protein
LGLPWLEREFGWASDDTALRFMQCHDFAKNRNLRDLNLPVSGLYLLAAPNTREEARGAVIERGQNGEALSLKEVQRVIEEARERAGVIVNRPYGTSGDVEGCATITLLQTISSAAAYRDGSGASDSAAIARGRSEHRRLSRRVSA